MSRDLKDITAEALELPLTARENDLLWAAEAERRYADYKAGKVAATPADEVFARLKSRKT